MTDGDVAELPYEAVTEELARTGVILPGIRTLFALCESQQPLRFGDLEMTAPEHSLEHRRPSLADEFCGEADRSLRELIAFT